MAGIPQIKVIFDRRKKASAVNPGTIEIEVSYNRERIRLSTGVAVLRQQWSGREVVNHIHVRGSGITGEKEHVPDNGVFRAASGKLYIPYLLEILPA